MFVDAGAWVVFLDRDEAAGKQLETELSGSAPGECKFLAGDVSRPEDLEKLVQTAVDSYGTIDCLLNNAGYHPPTRRIDNFTAEEFRDVLNINLVNYFTACQLALPYLRKSKGSIVNISSLVGEMGQEGSSRCARQCNPAQQRDQSQADCGSCRLRKSRGGRRLDRFQPAQ